MRNMKNKNKSAFTLAEVLITLAIIGVIAAIAIPSVINNAQQQEFKTGLRKAVSVLNSAITMNMALDGESPYENYDTYRYLQRHMSVMYSMVTGPKYNEAGSTDTSKYKGNLSFYTTDGMRYEFLSTGTEVSKFVLYEDNSIQLRGTVNNDYGSNRNVDSYTTCEKISKCARCGAYGLNSNNDLTTNAPCLVIVDVNGDRKPYPSNASCYSTACANENIRKYADPLGTKLTDTFPVMITDKAAIPYGFAAQKAMYEARK